MHQTPIQSHCVSLPHLTSLAHSSTNVQCSSWNHHRYTEWFAGLMFSKHSISSALTTHTRIQTRMLTKYIHLPFPYFLLFFFLLYPSSSSLAGSSLVAGSCLIGSRHWGGSLSILYSSEQRNETNIGINRACFAMLP